jgi:hypothetical protein
MVDERGECCDCRCNQAKSPGPLKVAGLFALQSIRFVVLIIIWWFYEH